MLRFVLSKPNITLSTRKNLRVCRGTCARRSRKNPGSWMDVKLNEHTGEFMAAFSRLDPPWNSSKLWDVMCRGRTSAIRLHRFSRVHTRLVYTRRGGAVLPVWAACFGGEWRNKNGESWNYCAAALSTWTHQFYRSAQGRPLLWLCHTRHYKSPLHKAHNRQRTRLRPNCAKLFPRQHGVGASRI
jgi:hypothetical protein